MGGLGRPVDTMQAESFAVCCIVDKTCLMSATNVDLNLLRALEALTREGSVTAAAARAGMTVPAMSRALGRLRDVLDDELFVRAGRGLVPTPRAIELRDRTQRSFEEALACLSPATRQPLARVSRTLVVRCSDAAAALVVGPLSALAARDAPSLVLRFVPEGDEDDAPLRDGRVDLDLGVQRVEAPELKVRRLFEDRFVAVVQRGHPLTKRRLTAESLVAAPHVVVSRAGRLDGPLDLWLAERGLRRPIAAVVGSFLAALIAVVDAPLIGTMPGRVASALSRHLGAKVLPLPAQLPTVPVGMAWHPRFDDDVAHRWLRDALTRLTAERTRPTATAAGSPGPARARPAGRRGARS
jgi:DNA-binding transcriptional LysR family regulator